MRSIGTKESLSDEASSSSSTVVDEDQDINILFDNIVD